MKPQSEIIIIAFSPLPEGMAFSNRVKSLARGIVEKEISVEILVPTPTEKTDKILNLNEEGTFYGVKYKYITGTIMKKKPYANQLLYFKSLFKIYFYIKRKRTVKNVILMMSEPFKILSFLPLKYLLSKRIYLENSEFPQHILSDKTSRFKNETIETLEKFLYKKIDGFFPISKALSNYYIKKGVSPEKIKIINITTDTNRFTSVGYKGSDTIVYCGNPDTKKEGVDILIKAFEVLNKKYENLKLLIIGGDKKSVNLKKLIKLSNDLNLTENIIFTGRVSSSKVIEYISGALLLTLARPNSKQAEGGFPTKLGEYLATGRPVVVTKVGDIPLFLKDGDNAFLAEPNNIESFAEKLEFVVNNPKFANQVGKAGQKLAQNEFNYKVQAHKIINFIFND